MDIFQPPWFWTLVALVAGLLLGGLIIGLWSQVRAQRKSEQLKTQFAMLKTQYTAADENLRRLEEIHSVGQKENEELKIRLAELQKLRESDAEKLQWIERAQHQMRETFEALASQTLQANSGEFLKHAREQTENLLRQLRGDWTTHKAELQHLVDPLKENLSSISGHVRELEQKREGAYQGLREQLRQLAKTHSELQTTTITLTQALKSPTVRGRWGEMQLRRVVEMAGMVKHVAFGEQVSTDTGRPDMIVHLPNGGVLPIDSKVPLESYLDALGASDEETRKTKLGRHARAMQTRVQELGQKRYWEQFDNSPEFIVMFVPNEACLGAAFEVNPSLLEYAIDKRVLITTPVTLLALLRAVAFGWQQHQITENARQIAEQGQELYKRLEIFIGHLGELGKDLRKTVAGYNAAIGSLEKRLLPMVRRFEEMGVAASELDAPEEVETQTTLPSTTRSVTSDT
jgi:DNA recombination protein RmuC